ncbi:MAG: universal stress protein [Candidatus Binatia bacterium]
MTASTEDLLGRNFCIFHPCDFSPASEVAFGHALKIALQSKAKFDLMHVAAGVSKKSPDWLDFPGVRETLARWGVLPEGVRRHEVEKTGVRVRKIITSGDDPVETMLKHFRRFPPDLIVLATQQKEGLARWLHKSVAEPLARRSRAMTLFIPSEGRGFVSLKDGSVALKRILVPIDHDPDPETAIRKALLLARGLDCFGGEVRLLHVGMPGTAPRIEAFQEPGWSYEVVVTEGEVVDQILEDESQWGPDLMVLATEGHMDFIDALRGSTTERVLRGAACPVLAIPANGRG